MDFAFVDIEKAYVRIRSSLLCRLLDRIGLSDRMASIINSMYENTGAIYKLGDMDIVSKWSKRGQAGLESIASTF